MKFADFGEYCFNTLIDSSQSSNELEQEVMAILKTEVIPSIKEYASNPKKLSVKLLQGLLEYVQETDNSTMLAELYA